MERLERLIDRLERLVSNAESGAERLPDRARLYREALEDTVRTLEATKKSFHSKQLKALRERVEAVLRQG